MNSANFTLTFTPQLSSYLSSTLDKYLKVYLNESLYTHWTLTNSTADGAASESYLLQLDFSCMKRSTCGRRILSRELQSTDSSYSIILVDFNLINNDIWSQIMINNITTMAFNVDNVIILGNTTNSTAAKAAASETRVRAIVKFMNACVGILFLSGVILLILSKGKNVTLYHYMSMASILNLFKYFDVGYPSDLALFYQLFEGETFAYPNLFQSSANPSNETIAPLIISNSEMMYYYGTTYNFFANFGSALTIIITPLPIWIVLVILLKKNCFGTKKEAAKKTLIEKLENLRYTFEFNWFISLMISFSARYTFSLILQWKQRGFNEAYSVLALTFTALTLPAYILLIFVQLRAFYGSNALWLRTSRQLKTLTGEYKHTRRAQIVPVILILRNVLFAMFVAIPNGDSKAQIIGALIVNAFYSFYCCCTSIYWRTTRGRFIKIMEMVINFMFVFPIVFLINKYDPYINANQEIAIEWLFLSLVFLIVIVLGIGHMWEATRHIYKLIAKACRNIEEIEEIEKSEPKEVELQKDEGKDQTSRREMYIDDSVGVEAGDVEISFDGSASTERKLELISKRKARPVESEDQDEDTLKRKSYQEIITVSSPIKEIVKANSSLSSVNDISADQGNSPLIRLKSITKQNSADSQENDSSQQETSLINISGMNDTSPSMRSSRLIKSSAVESQRDAPNTKNEFSKGSNLHKDLDEMEEEKSIDVDPTTLWKRDSPERRDTANSEEIESPSKLIKRLLNNLKKSSAEDEENPPQTSKIRHTRNYSQSERMQTELTTPGMSRRGSDLFKNMNDQSAAIADLEEEEEEHESKESEDQEGESPVEQFQRIENSQISLNESFGVPAPDDKHLEVPQQVATLKQEALKNESLNASFGPGNNQNKEEEKKEENSNEHCEKQEPVLMQLRRVEGEEPENQSNEPEKDKIPEWKTRGRRWDQLKMRSNKVIDEDNADDDENNFSNM